MDDKDKAIEQAAIEANKDTTEQDTINLLYTLQWTL